jgi:hypothetical protein
LKEKITENGWIGSAIRVRPTKGFILYYFKGESFSALGENSTYQVLDGNHRIQILKELIASKVYTPDLLIDVTVYDIIEDLEAVFVAAGTII